MKKLFNCYETEVKSIKEISLGAKDWQIKKTELFIDMNKAINYINEKFEEFEKDLKKKEEEIKHSRKENSSLDKRLVEMDPVVD